MVRRLFLGFGVLDPANDVEQPRRLYWIDVVDADDLRHRHNKPLISRGQVIDCLPQIAKHSSDRWLVLAQLLDQAIVNDWRELLRPYTWALKCRLQQLTELRISRLFFTHGHRS